MSSGQIASADADAGYDTLETGQYVIRWKGFLFVPGCVAGEASASRILDEWHRKGPDSALDLARGTFVVSVFEKCKESTWYAVDPFGLTRLFVSGTAISDDLFALVRTLGAGQEEINVAALAAFLRFGFFDRNRTVDRRVRVLGGRQIARLDGESVRLYDRGRSGLRAETMAFDFRAYVADLSIALRGQKISLDLTGGFDSRVVAACLVRAGVPIAEAVTSGQDGNRDATIAKRIAAALDIPHVRIRHRIAGFERRALSLLRLTYGQMGILTYDHMFQIQQERLARGMTLGIGGAGGELWKDFLWLQDFPRLRGAPDFARLYRRRFEPRTPSGAFLSAKFSGLFEAAGPEYLADMVERFGGLQRTAAYDRAYAELRLPFLMGPSVTGGILAGLPHFSPLLDPDGVDASSHMPPRERLFSRWHRRALSRVAPELMCERTTEGLSARIGISAASDAPYYLADKVRRAAQKITQGFNLPDIVQSAVEDPETLAYGRRMSLSSEAIERLKTLGILREGITPEQLSRAALDRVLTAGLTLLEIMP